MSKQNLPKQSEKGIQDFILNYLEINRIGFFWRNNTGAMKTMSGFMKFGKVGSADILGVLEGRFVAIECKRQGKKNLDEAQEKFRYELESSGGIYYLANNVDSALVWIKELRHILKNNLNS